MQLIPKSVMSLKDRGELERKREDHVKVPEQLQMRTTV